jgi:outer membrane protein OmpA-like peptidoglycan-associated protein
VPDQAAFLKLLAPEITAVLQKAQLLRKSVVLEVVGHSDSTGPESTNQLLSRDRAENVTRQLVREGAARDSLRPTGVAASEPLRPETDEQARQYNRSVTFNVSPAEPSKP